MIVLRIFLAIIWLFVVLTYSILCGVHIREQKVFRIIILGFLAFAILLSYFVFPQIVFLSLSILGLIFYVVWEHQQAYLKPNINVGAGFTCDNVGVPIYRDDWACFKPSKFTRSFCSWIFVKEEDTLISLVFPRFLTYFVVLVLSVKRKFRPFLKGVGGIDIDVQSKNEIVSIHI